MSAPVKTPVESPPPRSAASRRIWDPAATDPDQPVDAIRLPKVGTTSGIREEKVKEEIAGLKAQRHMRYVMVFAVAGLFVVLNGIVVSMVADAAASDESLIIAKIMAPSERLITEKVYISLVGATVVQVSSILIAIARYLFPSGKGTKD